MKHSEEESSDDEDRDVQTSDSTSEVISCTVKGRKLAQCSVAHQRCPAQVLLKEPKAGGRVWKTLGTCCLLKDKTMYIEEACLKAHKEQLVSSFNSANPTWKGQTSIQRFNWVHSMEKFFPSVATFIYFSRCFLKVQLPVGGKTSQTQKNKKNHIQRRYINNKSNTTTYCWNRK